jgi:hypothetical protein
MNMGKSLVATSHIATGHVEELLIGGPVVPTPKDVEASKTETEYAFDVPSRTSQDEVLNVVAEDNGGRVEMGTLCSAGGGDDDSTGRGCMVKFDETEKPLYMFANDAPSVLHNVVLEVSDPVYFPGRNQWWVVGVPIVVQEVFPGDHLAYTYNSSFHGDLPLASQFIENFLNHFPLDSGCLLWVVDMQGVKSAFGSLSDARSQLSASASLLIPMIAQTDGSTGFVQSSLTPLLDGEELKLFAVVLLADSDRSRLLCQVPKVEQWSRLFRPQTEFNRDGGLSTNRMETEIECWGFTVVEDLYSPDESALLLQALQPDEKTRPYSKIIVDAPDGGRKTCGRFVSETFDQNQSSELEKLDLLIENMNDFTRDTPTSGVWRKNFCATQPWHVDDDVEECWQVTAAQKKTICDTRDEGACVSRGCT